MDCGQEVDIRHEVDTTRSGEEEKRSGQDVTGSGQDLGWRVDEVR